MSDVICKHGWSRRFCEQCSQAHIIASLKGPGDKGMLANPPDDLVERVARVMAVVEGFDPDLIINNDTPDCPQPLWRLYRRSAPAAIAVCMEEAAKVAGKWQQMYFEDEKVHSSNITEYIVADILALAKGPQ